tara:strand:+ start:1151 stop:2332 length:1182 start_codon:yes stop_codon:yes gene_type:complete
MIMWLKNLNIWDGVSDELIAANAIKINGNQITAITDSSSKVQDDEQVHDLQGLYCIPGLIDAHVHMCLNPSLKDPLEQDKPDDAVIISEMTTRAEQMLAAGITTARDLGGGNWLELELRDQINRGEVVGTRLICSGQPITSVGGHCYFWGGEATDATDALGVIKRQISHGVDLIKVMATGGTITKGSTPSNAQFDADVLKAIVDEATANDFHVAAHCHGTAGIKNATSAGVSTIEHCSWVSEEGWGRGYDAEIVEEMRAKGVVVSPTINAGWKRFIGSKQFESMVKGNYTKMREAGIKLIASTDAGIPNVFHHDLPKAIPVFAHFAGLSNAGALRAATSDCAEAIGLGAVVGKVAVGLDADLVFYSDNPLNNLDVLASPVKVMSRGRLIDVAG